MENAARFRIIAGAAPPVAGQRPDCPEDRKDQKQLAAGYARAPCPDAPSVGTTADDVTPADHMIALAIGLDCCIEALSVCTPKKGRCSNSHRVPAG